MVSLEKCGRAHNVLQIVYDGNDRKFILILSKWLTTILYYPA